MWLRDSAHQSPIRIKAGTVCCACPWLHWQPQKTLCSPSRPIVASKRARTDLWFRPRSFPGDPTLGGSRYGRSFALLRRGRWWRAIRSPGYANPLAALPPPPHCSLSERSRHVEGLTALHDVVARPRQLVGHRLDGYHRQRAGALLLVEALDAFVVAHRKVRRFDEGPGQVPVAALGVAFSFFLPFDSRRLLTVRA